MQPMKNTAKNNENTFARGQFAVQLKHEKPLLNVSVPAARTSSGGLLRHQGQKYHVTPLSFVTATTWSDNGILVYSHFKRSIELFYLKVAEGTFVIMRRELARTWHTQIQLARLALHRAL